MDKISKRVMEILYHQMLVGNDNGKYFLKDGGLYFQYDFGHTAVSVLNDYPEVIKFFE